MTHNRCRRYAVATLVLAGGCTAVRPATAPLNDNPRPIEVRFASPRTLDACTRAGVPVTLHRTRELRGRVLEASGDTLVLMVRAVRAFELWEALSPVVVVTLRTSDPGVRILERYVSSRRTAMAVVLAPPIIAYALFAFACGVMGPCWT